MANGSERATERDNLRVWDGRTRGHYEVWYLTLNHRPSRTGFWIRYTLEAPTAHDSAPGGAARPPYAQLWFAAFDAAEPARGFALNRRYPIEAHGAAAAPFEVRIGDATLGHDRARGSIEGAGHAARWDLRWTPAATTHRQLPALVYRTAFADTKVLSPNLDVAVRGTIELDGRTLALDGEPGGQTHLWGRKHAHAWAWGHCNAFPDRPGAALEALSVRLRRRGVVLPPLTLVGLHLDGEALELTGFRHVLASRGRFGTGRYDFLARGAAVELEGSFACRPEDLVTAEYHDPDGEPAYCANTEVGDLTLVVRRRGRLGRLVEAARLLAPGTGHFEIGARTPDPRVTRRHVTVGP